MRNPGYMAAMQVWEHKCDVLFNGMDFGPNLMYRILKFTPAKNREQLTQIPGMPWYLDRSDQPAGYPVPEAIKGTLELWVRDPRAWGQPGPPDGRSPESRFIEAVCGGLCKLEARSFNGLHLMCLFEVSQYGRFELGFKIVLKFRAQPYFWESGNGDVTWTLNSLSRVNLFDPNTATVTTTPGATCTWVEGLLTSHGSPRYVLHAEPGGYAEVRVGGLVPSKRYTFGARQIYNHGLWQLYDEQGRRLWDNPVTGVSAIVFRLISKSAKALAVGFADLCVYEAGAGAETGEIWTLDAPLRTLQYTADAPCTLYLAGEPFDLTLGENLTVYGLNIPPRSRVPVMITSIYSCSGMLQYRRGVRVCTL